jgi:hypothetical protein
MSTNLHEFGRTPPLHRAEGRCYNGAASEFLRSGKRSEASHRRLFGKAWRRVSKGFSIQVKPRWAWDYGGIRRSLCFQKQQRPGGTNGAAYISTGRQCARCDQLSWRNLPVDGVEGRGTDVKGEEQAEADQGQRAERVNPPAAAAACSGGPAGAGGGNTGEQVEPILATGGSAAQEDIANHILHRPEQTRGMEPVERSARSLIRMRNFASRQAYEGTPFSFEKTSLCSCHFLVVK